MPRAEEIAEFVPAELARMLAESPALMRSYIVGGCVRDWLLGCVVKDCDIEVFGVTYEQLAEALQRWGKTDFVGRSFGVVKLAMSDGSVFDFTIPRRDSKVAPGHKGFSVSFDAEISLREAAARRDFTINSLMYDPRRKEIVDSFGGQRDLEDRVLRHTSAAFTEDPLRVLRGMQLAARFGLTPDASTIELCRSMKQSQSELAFERVREEWFKWASKSSVPSAGLRFLEQTEWIEHYPELDATRLTPQDPGWHPEGNVFVHTCHCCDALVKLPQWQNADDETRIALSFATLTHDFGKATTTFQKTEDGQTRIVSPGHEDASVGLATTFLERFRTPQAIIDRVVPLVRNHMAHIQEVTDRNVRRLSKRLEPEIIENLCTLMTADAFGRPPRPQTVPSVVPALRAKAAELQVQSRAPQPILLGRHLVELGMEPGPKIGAIVKEAYEAQLEGKFFDLEQAFHWLALQFPDLADSARAALEPLKQAR